MQIDGVGGDDHALTLGYGEQRRGQEIGHGLAYSGAAFHHQMLVVVNGFGDAVQHLFLLGTVLEPGKPLREGTVLGQESSDFVLAKVAQGRVRAAFLRRAQPDCKLL